MSKELPSLEDMMHNSSDIDIDNLEAQFSLLNSKYGKSKTAGGGVGMDVLKSPGKAAKQTADVEVKKKKKRKVILPKNYLLNPNIPLDAERWLPLRERSYYKGKRRKKNAVGKGTQGAVSSSSK